MRRTRTVGIAVAAALLGLAGCAAPSTPGTSATALPSTSTPEPALGPRPAVLPLNGLDPCNILTAQQNDELKVDTKAPGSDGTPDPQCVLISSDSQPTITFQIHLSLNQPASALLAPSDPLVTTTQVAGFPTIQTHAAGSDGNTDCINVIDVAPNQNLRIGFSNDYGDYPGLNRQLACQLADKASTMALTNLRARGGN